MRHACFASTQLIFTIGLIAAMSACDPDEANPAARCEGGAPCPSGSHCYRTYCVPDQPAVNPGDSGEEPPDEETDASAPLPDVSTVCAMTATACGGICVDLSLDNANCGECGHVCGEDKQCSAGVCCKPLIEIGCDGACVHPLDDEHHCGGCDIRCGADQHCVEGLCVLS